MKIFKIFLGVALAAAIIAEVTYVSAQKRPRLEKKCEENFTKTDTDKDGKVSLKEFMAVDHPRGITAEEIFKSKDADKDGFLTKDEFCTKGAGQRKGVRRGR